MFSVEPAATSSSDVHESGDTRCWRPHSVSKRVPASIDLPPLMLFTRMLVSHAAWKPLSFCPKVNGGTVGSASTSDLQLLPP